MQTCGNQQKNVVKMTTQFKGVKIVLMKPRPKIFQKDISWHEKNKHSKFCKCETNSYRTARAAQNSIKVSRNDFRRDETHPQSSPWQHSSGSDVILPRSIITSSVYPTYSLIDVIPGLGSWRHGRDVKLPQPREPAEFIAERNSVSDRG